MFEKRIYFYVIRKGTYELLRTMYIKDEYISVDSIRFAATFCRDQSGEDAMVFIADGDRDLALLVREVRSTNSIESKVVLKLHLEQYGLRVL